MTVLRYSANLGFLWPDRPLLERIDAAAGAGFKAIELHWPYDTPAAEVRARCERHGLKLLGINTVRGNLAAGENGLGALAGREAEFQAAVDQSIAYCLEAGGTAIHCMAGFVPAEAREAAARVFVKNLREASDKAAPHGLTLLLEALNPHDAPGYFYSTQAEAARIQEEAGRANIKLMFDVYHVGAAEGDVLRRLTRYLPAIGHVQIAAVPSRAEPDEGEINYRAVLDHLAGIGYGGWVGLEYKPRAGTDEGMGWVKALGISL
ncbi:TIM barrel protein [Chelatococcus sp.]|uniref:hydroxypyruvate isomerase family protein n=1 Tax=Chelatococcus sp. TaxID=1953771 RepID=UPI003439A351